MSGAPHRLSGQRQLKVLHSVSLLLVTLPQQQSTQTLEASQLPWRLYWHRPASHRMLENCRHGRRPGSWAPGPASLHRKRSRSGCWCRRCSRSHGCRAGRSGPPDSGRRRLLYIPNGSFALILSDKSQTKIRTGQRGRFPLWPILPRLPFPYTGPPVCCIIKTFRRY